MMLHEYSWKNQSVTKYQSNLPFCLPFYEDNNTSVFQPQWLMWDEQEREKWVQPMPKDAISLGDLDESLMEIYQSANMNPDKFLRNFAHWYASHHGFEPVACGVGIRTQESLYRYRSITSPKYNFRKQCWIKRQVADSMVVNFTPSMIGKPKMSGELILVLTGRSMAFMKSCMIMAFRSIKCGSVSLTACSNEKACTNML